MNHAQCKLGNGQTLLTAQQVKLLPALNSTKDQGEQARAYARFRVRQLSWYATEFDSKTGVFRGYICNGMKWGRIQEFDAEELQVWGVERDEKFAPKTVAEIKASQLARRAGVTKRLVARNPMVEA